MRKEIYKALASVRQNARIWATPWEVWFENMPEGDFCYEEDFAGDWEYYPTEDGWQKQATAVNICRDEGVENLEVAVVDADGNWDCVEWWHKEDTQKADYAHWCAEMSWEYTTLNYALYMIEVVETGEDPLGDDLSGDLVESSKVWLATSLPSLLLDVTRKIDTAKQ